jgi:hypothetical protein
MDLKQEIKEILDDGDYIKVAKLDKGFEIEYGKRDSGVSPSLSFSKLKSLSELFGTDEIDVDDYCNSGGCDTCDYGSDFGHTIQIYNPTLNVEEMSLLVGTYIKGKSKY